MTESVEGVADAPQVAPRTRHEEMLFEIWQDVLGKSEMGVEDDFFALGGNSLHVIRIISRLGECTGVEFPLQFVHEYPTVAEGAARLDVMAAESGGATPEPSTAGEPHRWGDDW